MKHSPTALQVGRAGELFVAGELNRRGINATLFLTNMPGVDIVAVLPGSGRTVTIQVKTKGPNSASWQWNLDKAEREQRSDESIFMVLVDLAASTPEYYVKPLRTVARAVMRRSKRILKKQGGERPRNPESRHTVIPLKLVADGKGAWEVLEAVE